MVFSADWFQKQILDRFLTYVKIHTTSDRHVDAIPSTPGQWDLLKLLADELRSIGVSDIELTEQGYLIARIPPTAGSEGVSTIAFMAHVDTVSDAPGEGVKPQVFRDYSGDVITLKGGVVIDPSKNDVLASRVGDTIITSDGTTLLGADDKAGIAEIVTAAA